MDRQRMTEISFHESTGQKIACTTVIFQWKSESSMTDVVPCYRVIDSLDCWLIMRGFSMDHAVDSAIVNVCRCCCFFFFVVHVDTLCVRFVCNFREISNTDRILYGNFEVRTRALARCKILLGASTKKNPVCPQSLRGVCNPKYKNTPKVNPKVTPKLTYPLDDGYRVDLVSTVLSPRHSFEE